MPETIEETAVRVDTMPNNELDKLEILDMESIITYEGQMRFLETELARTKVLLGISKRTIFLLRKQLKRAKLRNRKKQIPKKPLRRKRQMSTQTDESGVLCDVTKPELRNFHELVMKALNRTNSPKSTKYGLLIRDFALKLHYYSPKAYDFVRETFCSTLPHPRCFQLWRSGIQTRTGN